MICHYCNNKTTAGCDHCNPPVSTTERSFVCQNGCTVKIRALEAKLRAVEGLPRHTALEAYVNNATLTIDNERWIKDSELESILRGEQT